MFEVVASVLILLHGPNGHEILINPATVSSMHAAISGKPNQLMTEEVKCLINTTDGKFLSVVESCDVVRKLLEDAK